MAKKQNKRTKPARESAAANKSSAAGKRSGQGSKAARNAPSKAPANRGLKAGDALRTRDEFLLGGVEKPEHKDESKLYYRVVYTVAVNGLNEAAVVKRTTKKGRHLKTRPDEKFREEIYIEDNEGNAIKIGEKFVRSVQDDIGKIDVEYILKRCRHYPDTAEKLKKFKERKKK